MSEKKSSDRPSRLNRIAEAMFSGGYGWLKIRGHEPSEHWRPETMTDEEYESWEKRNEARHHLGRVALADPVLGKAIFDALRISEDPRQRITAATMVPKLFHDEELKTNESVQELKQDNDYEVRDAIGDALIFGSDLDRQ